MQKSIQITTRNDPKSARYKAGSAPPLKTVVNDELPWEWLRAFAEVSLQGSVLAAAKSLGLTQPSVSRQIAALEERLGYALFVRSRRGVQATERALALLPAALAMREQSQSLNRLAQGQQEGLAGRVRITASEIMAAHFLPAMLEPLVRGHRNLNLVVIASNSLSSLSERQADIAIRMVRPTQSSLVAKHVGNLPVVLAGHRDLIRRVGLPQRAEALFDYPIIGYDKDPLLIQGLEKGGLAKTTHRWVAQTDNHLVYFQMVLKGLGFGFIGASSLVSNPELVQVLPEIPTPKLPIWLAMHQDLRQSPRMKLVFDHLATSFGRSG